MYWFKHKNGQDTKDKMAFQILFSDNYEMVYKKVFYMTNDEDLSKDITQNTFIRAFENIHKLNNPDKFKPWILKIAMNVSKEMIKQKNNHIRNTTPIYNEEGKIKDSLLSLISLDNVEEQCEALEVVEEILDYIDNTLSLEEKEILYLKYYENLSYKQISKYMNMNQSTIGMKILRVRKRLADKLKINYGKGGLENNG